MQTRRLATWAAVIMLGLLVGGLIRSPEHVTAQAAPTLKITAPANGATISAPVTIMVAVTGVTLKAAAEADPASSHLHYFVDRDPTGIVMPGQPIPAGQPDIIHTASLAQDLPSLTPGQHTVWVVLGHLDHMPYDPSIQDKVTFTVAAAAATPAATTAAPVAAPAATPAASGGLPTVGTAGLLGGHSERRPWALTISLAALLVAVGVVSLYWARRGVRMGS